MHASLRAPEKDGGKPGRKGGPGDKKGGGNMSEDLVKIVKLIKDKQFYPAIIFSFSRRECESYSTQVGDMVAGGTQGEVVVRGGALHLHPPTHWVCCPVICLGAGHGRLCCRTPDLQIHA